MNHIKKLIDALTDEIRTYEHCWEDAERCGHSGLAQYYGGRIDASWSIIARLNVALKKQEISDHIQEAEKRIDEEGDQ